MTMVSPVAFDRLAGSAERAAAGGSVPAVLTVATDCSNCQLFGGLWDLKAVIAIEKLSKNALF